MKKVSIIVAVYNVKDYVEKCLVSIKNQTYKNIEVIVVDDGSKDGSGDICDRIAAMDDRFKVIHKDNAGLGFARNTGLEYVSGEFVEFVDGDDFLEPNMVETLVKYQEETCSDMIICGFKRYIDESHIKDVSTIKTPISYIGKDDIMKHVLCPIIGSDASKKSHDGREMCVWTNLYSAELIKKHDLKFVSERKYLSEDFFFNIPYFRHCEKITIIPECLYDYRYNPSSLSNAYRPNRVQLLENFMERARVLLDEEGVSQYSSKRLQRLFFMKFRNSLLHISAADIPFKEKKLKVSEAIVGTQCIEALKDYPVKDVKTSDAIMIKLIENRKAFLLLMYMYVQTKMIAVRNYIRTKKND